MMEDYNKVLYRLIFSVIGIFVIFSIIFGTFYTIPAGYQGVLLTFGKIDMNTQTEGLHIKIPIVQQVIKLDTRTQKYSANASAASNDLQIVETEIATNYHLQKNSVAELYNNIGINYQDSVIQPAVQEVVKATTAKFTAEELITKREQVKEQIKVALIDRLASRNIVVEDISITNFDFSQSFNDAIEAKVTAEQLKLKAMNDLERIKVEAQQTVVSATAQAEALKLQKQEITPDLLQLRQIEVNKMMIEKWNGIMPLYVGGSANPFISLTEMNGNTIK
jgi:regulator of protease activity HflC (stomatin/prohibitin superfamily)